MIPHLFACGSRSTRRTVEQEIPAGIMVENILFWKEMKIFRHWVCQFESDGADVRMKLTTLLA